MRWRRSPRRPGSAGPRAPRPGPGPGPAARSPPPLLPLLPLLLLCAAALAPGAAAGDEAAPAGASVCYSSPPSVGSVQELAQRAAVVIEGKVHPPRRQQGALDRTAAAAAGEAGAAAGAGAGAGARARGAEREPPARPGARGPPGPDPLPAANGTEPSRPSALAPRAGEPGDDEAPYLVKVHQVWAVKAGGLKKDSLLTVRLGAWGHPAFPSCGRLKEDSRYIFFMEPDANSSSRAPAAFRASFPPLETGRNLKKEVSRVLCKRCAKVLRKQRFSSVPFLIYLAFRFLRLKPQNNKIITDNSLIKTNKRFKEEGGKSRLISEAGMRDSREEDIQTNLDKAMSSTACSERARYLCLFFFGYLYPNSLFSKMCQNFYLFSFVPFIHPHTQICKSN
ncbi:unnamed protein product [Nyctereutes procyonoides]|uniref:(raccoon dog) hypothetical protein n=1 Tax=Nyctereutes procyonoides TaxID=34880 RepID=A0A811YVL0_NYCPR|nr:unnamed protein product [Nyctereutes procyonoides]